LTKYNIEYACGHDGKISLFGPSRDRERKLDWYQNTALCPECWEEKLIQDRIEATEKAIAAAKEEGLPILKGSEKQTAWAEVIRAEKLGQLNKSLEGLPDSDNKRFPGMRESILRMVDRIHLINSAHWWIEERFVEFDVKSIVWNLSYKTEKTGVSLLTYIDNAYTDHIESDVSNVVRSPQEKEMEIAALTEALVRPEKVKTETIAEIHILKTSVEVKFPERREDFREIVKIDLGYSWNSDKHRWCRQITETTGTTTDRAAELGNALLRAGFIIRILDTDIRKAAISGEFEPECKRWIHCKGSDFGITWERPEDWFSRAKQITGSKWAYPFMYVPHQQFEEVLDFADLHGFKLTIQAQEAADAAKAVKEATLTVKPVKRSHDISAFHLDAVPPKLLVPEHVEVLNEFKD
jgi:hypothetical protein